MVLHSEFYNLRNFRCWRDNKHNGISNWPHNINDRGWIPICLFNALERFIDEQFSKQARNWHRQRMNDVEENGNGKERQRLNEMSSEDVEKDFTKMMKERNDAIRKAGGDLPEMADDGVTYATCQIQRPLYH